MQAQDLAAFKSDLTALMTKDMIHSSLSAFASQSKSDQGGKGKSSQDQETSQDIERSRHHIVLSEREEGELASEPIFMNQFFSYFPKIDINSYQ